MSNARHLPRRLAVAVIGITSANLAWPEANPYYVGVSQAFTRESNVFRVPNGQPRSNDTYSTTSLLAGIDQPISRQRLFGDFAARHNRYRDNEQLDHTGYSADVGLDWETIGSLTGRVGYTLKENLARYGADLGPAITSRNLERSQEFVARGQYGSVGLLSLEASYAHRRLDYSAPEFAFEEFNQDSVRAGVLYRPGALLTLGAAVRHTRGEYPFAIAPGGGTTRDPFTRNDADFTALYAVTGQSTIKARLSYTRQRHDAVTARNVSGSTGAISWDYKPTAKLAFTTEAIRDTGAETAFFGLGQSGTGGVGNNSVLSNTLALKVGYDATAKVQVQASGRYVERDLINALSTGGLPASGSDRYGEVRLGITWKPIAAVTLGCGVSREKRSTSSALSYAYSANVASCLGQFTLQ